MVVVPENLIRNARIEDRQLIDPQEYVFQLRDHELLTTFDLQSFQSFLERLLNRACERLARLGRDFACQAFDVYTLYTHCHSRIIPYYTKIHIGIPNANQRWSL